jgi:cbb3-type cytochrome oxidase maturation protein
VSVLFVLVPVALLLVILFVAAYAWSSRSGQFDDLTTPALRALHDDAARAPETPAVPTPPPPTPGPPAAR